MTRGQDCICDQHGRHVMGKTLKNVFLRKIYPLSLNLGIHHPAVKLNFFLSSPNIYLLPLFARVSFAFVSVNMRKSLVSRIS